MNEERSGVWTAAVLFGGLWGLAEATLGTLLHLAARVVPLPGLAGFLMFPLGLACLLGAWRAAGRPAAVPAAAVVAAGVKISSLLHPAVTGL